MGKSDQWVTITLVVFILMHLSVLIAGFLTGKTSLLTTMVNLVAGLSIIMYWIQNELHIRQHTIELREIVVLFFEVVVIALAAYSILSAQRYRWLPIFHYVIFGFNLACLVLFLVFMVTFKMNKLI